MANDKCNEYRELILRAMLEDLPPDLRAELDTHLSGCTECRDEQALCEATRLELSDLEEAPVPRHFFVSPDSERIGAWQLLRRLTLPWKLALAATLMAALLLAGLAASDFRFRAENGVYAFSFGQPLPQPASRTEVENQVKALRTELEGWVERKIVSERQLYLAALKIEVEKADGRRLTPQQSLMLRAALDEVEGRLTSRIDTTGSVLETKMADSVTSLYDRLQLQRAQDLIGIRSTLSQAAIQNEANDRQTHEVLSTLLEVADLRIREQN